MAIRAQIDVEANIASGNFWWEVRGFIRNICHRYTQYHHPILLYEFDHHDLWYMLIKAAKVTSVKDASQDRLVISVLYARELGTLKWALASGDQNDSELQIALTSHGRIWTDLPFLAKDMQEAWREFLMLQSEERHNLEGFVARLAALDSLSLCRIWLLRETLETPRRLTTSEIGI